MPSEWVRHLENRERNLELAQIHERIYGQVLAREAHEREEERRKRRNAALVFAGAVVVALTLAAVIVKVLGQ